MNTMIIILLICKSEDVNFFQEKVDFMKNWITSSEEFLPKFLDISNRWEFYYTYKTREIFRLEYSTKMRFNLFLETKSYLNNYFTS